MLQLFEIRKPGGQKTALWGSKKCIIVYAGQHYDAETGLHYNYHRYYDPKLGRYLRADPIGLVGGINLYAYVQNNPVNWVDPYGLDGIAAAIGRAAIKAAPGVAISIGGATGTAVAADLVAPRYAGEGSDIIIPLYMQNRLWNEGYLTADRPPGFWPGPSGAAEWGRRTGLGAKEGKRRFHRGVKQNCPESNATDDYLVNPDTGDVMDPEGDIVGNLEDARAK